MAAQKRSPRDCRDLVLGVVGLQTVGLHLAAVYDQESQDVNRFRAVFLSGDNRPCGEGKDFLRL